MITDHDRFEALAGAVALGEATALERECFAAHARECVSCADDSAGSARVRDVIASARDAESWRPSLRDAVFARIHERRSGGSRRAIGALGWAFAASVVLNAAVVSGVAGGLGHALRDRESSDIVASHIRFDAPRPIVVPTPLPRIAVARVALAHEPSAPQPSAEPGSTISWRDSISPTGGVSPPRRSRAATLRKAMPSHRPCPAPIPPRATFANRARARIRHRAETRLRAGGACAAARSSRRRPRRCP